LKRQEIICNLGQPYRLIFHFSLLFTLNVT